MSCITLGVLNKKYILYPVICLIVLIIENYFALKTSLLKNIYEHKYIKIANRALGKSLSFILFIILKIKNKNKNKNLLDKKIYKIKYLEEVKSMKTKKILYLIICSLLNFAYVILYDHLIKFKIDIFCSLWIFDIIHIIILSYFILHIKLYKHQYFSILIIITLGLIMDIIETHDQKISIINEIKSFFIEIIFSLNIVINKYLMENLFCSAYEICFYEGIIGLILAIICIIIFTNKPINSGDIEYKNKKYFDNFFDYMDKLNTKEVFVFIFETIYILIITLLYLLTIKFYTVYHIFIILIIDEGNYFLYNFEDWELYITIIIYLLFVFMILIFNENLEINCLGLEENTKRNISKRAITSNIECPNDEDNPKEDNKEEIVELDNYYFSKTYDEEE